MILGYQNSSVHAFNLLCKRWPNYRLEPVAVDSFIAKTITGSLGIGKDATKLINKKLITDNKMLKQKLVREGKIIQTQNEIIDDMGQEKSTNVLPIAIKRMRRKKL
jgi:hypothetical protein